MPSLWKHPASPFWTACFSDANGRRVKRSTKLRERAAAMRTALEWERLAKAGREGRLAEAQARRVVSDLIEQATGEPLHFHSCRGWLEEWLSGKRGTAAPTTLAKYEQTVRDFLDHLGARADLPLASISVRDVRSFRDALAKGGRAASTVNMAVRKTLGVAFLAAVRLGYIPMNPCGAVDALRDDDEKERDTFTSEQVCALVDAAEGDWRGAILAGYYTGLRLRDVAELKWESVDFEAGVLRVKARKTGSALVLPLHPELEAWLRSRPRGIARAPVFPELAGKGTGGRFGLSGRFKAILDKAAIKGRILRERSGAGRQTTSLSFHSLRHSFNSALANAGVAQELRQRLTGHASAAMNDRYTHHEVETMRAAVAKLPRLAPAK